MIPHGPAQKCDDERKADRNHKRSEKHRHCQGQRGADAAKNLFADLFPVQRTTKIKGKRLFEMIQKLAVPRQK